MEGPPCFITLVHGTWATRAAWLKEDSVFCDHIRQTLGSNARFLAFAWSGANTQLARLKAADELSVHLTRMMAEHPDASHFVVGHSHGGSVALYALLRDKLSNRVDGVICLSTPFISVRERYLGTMRRIPLTLAASFGIMQGLLFTWAFGVLMNIEGLSSVWLPIASGLIAAPFFIHWIFRGTPQFEFERKLRQRIIGRYRLPNVSTGRLLIIRVAETKRPPAWRPRNSSAGSLRSRRK